MKLVNTYKQVRKDWYSWTVRLEGTQKELNQINNVTYHLHETFSNPILVSSDPSTNFARSTAGWGEFSIKAEAEMKSGEVKHAKFWLDLGFEHTKERKEQFTGDFS